MGCDALSMAQAHATMGTSVQPHILNPVFQRAPNHAKMTQIRRHFTRDTGRSPNNLLNSHGSFLKSPPTLRLSRNYVTLGNLMQHV